MLKQQPENFTVISAVDFFPHLLLPSARPEPGSMNGGEGSLSAAHPASPAGSFLGNAFLFTLPLCSSPAIVLQPCQKHKTLAHI